MDIKKVRMLLALLIDEIGVADLDVTTAPPAMVVPVTHAKTTADTDDAPLVSSLPTANGPRATKVYQLRKGWEKLDSIVKGLKGNNAKVFAVVRDASKKGKTINARDASTKAGVHWKTTESNLYQLRTMQLIESINAE